MNGELRIATRIAKRVSLTTGQVKDSRCAQITNQTTSDRSLSGVLWPHDGLAGEARFREVGSSVVACYRFRADHGITGSYWGVTGPVAGNVPPSSAPLAPSASRVSSAAGRLGSNGVRGDCNVKRHSPTPSFPPTGLLYTYCLSMSREGGFLKYQFERISLSPVALHTSGDEPVEFVSARAGIRIGLHGAKTPQRSNLASIARRVKSRLVQTPLVVPNVPRIAAEVEE